MGLSRDSQVMFCHEYECKLIVLQCSMLALSSPAYGCFKIVAWMFLLQSKAAIVAPYFWNGGARAPPLPLPLLLGDLTLAKLSFR